ncbi:hypothetical protein P5673_030156 [Acropora cervicornis]|uniref:Uncharacterized protein n=1 Tax=Acropora cervicornis TaxID=6130 RepID=A0AAD9UTH3_ACRCE|nr:hypothetical protein P5673_030156 [Acropora cervicornis]
MYGEDGLLVTRQLVWLWKMRSENFGQETFQGSEPKEQEEVQHRVPYCYWRMQNILAKDCNAVESGVFTKEDCLSQCKDVFSVEGKLEGHLHLTVQAVKVPRRRLPNSVKEPLKNELDRLSCIKPLTDWISAIVVTTKHVGLCIVPKPLNQALHSNHYHLPTTLRTLTRKGSRFLSISNFWQIQLDELSYLATAAPWNNIAGCESHLGCLWFRKNFRFWEVHCSTATLQIVPIYFVLELNDTRFRKRSYNGRPISSGGGKAFTPHIRTSQRRPTPKQLKKENSREIEQN